MLPEPDEQAVVPAPRGRVGEPGANLAEELDHAVARATAHGVSRRSQSLEPQVDNERQDTASAIAGQRLRVPNEPR